MMRKMRRDEEKKEMEELGGGMGKHSATLSKAVIRWAAKVCSSAGVNRSDPKKYRGSDQMLHSQQRLSLEAADPVGEHSRFSLCGC